MGKAFVGIDPQKVRVSLSVGKNFPEGSLVRITYCHAPELEFWNMANVVSS